MPKPDLLKLAVEKRQRLFYSILILLISQISTAQPSTPKFDTYQYINSRQFSPIGQSPIPNQGKPIIANDPYAEQNRKILQGAGMTVPGPTNSPSQESEDDPEERGNHPNITITSYPTINAFQANFQEFLQLNPDSFSITKAVYLSESAFYDNSTLPSFKAFQLAIGKRTELVKQILRKEGLDEKHNVSLNYAIQKLYNSSNVYFDSSTGHNYWVEKMKYDFDDFMGDSDWTKMYVNKLLHTGSGQCHSLPLLYLCVAEHLHAKAYLSLAPNHSFIQYFDSAGNRYNFETTNGYLVSQTWLAGSNFVTAGAIRNKTYLDTLSSRRLYAQCLADLLLSYLMKVRHYDEFSDRIVKAILNVDPVNTTALMEQTNLKYLIYQRELQAAGNPPQHDYGKYPRVYNVFEDYQLCQRKVEQTGFEEMPKEMYQQWLKTLDSERGKQENQREQERVEHELKKIKGTRQKIINNNSQ